jgi:hypothetical protein
MSYAIGALVGATLLMYLMMRGIRFILLKRFRGSWLTALSGFSAVLLAISTASVFGMGPDKFFFYPLGALIAAGISFYQD